MAWFEMIKYHGREYPSDIRLKTEEIAAHFDVAKIEGELCWSLHTEYSYGKRKYNTALIERYPEILLAQKEGVPQLWKNEAWALEFADFLFQLVGDNPEPRVIEIHPPFNDYTDIFGFIQTYSNFETKVKEKFPGTEILIENRCGSVYHGGKFVISKITDISRLCELIEATGLDLKIAYDVPQIYTAHQANKEEIILKLIEETKPLRKHIGGVHLWGKRISNTGRKVSHCGDLDSYFGDKTVKKHFLQAFNDCFDDGIIRKMVLEVNSGNDDLQSIIKDLRDTGVNFV